jgi:hypothetical protein
MFDIVGRLSPCSPFTEPAVANPAKPSAAPLLPAQDRFPVAPFARLRDPVRSAMLEDD